MGSVAIVSHVLCSYMFLLSISIISLAAFLHLVHSLTFPYRDRLLIPYMIDKVMLSYVKFSFSLRKYTFWSTNKMMIMTTETDNITFPAGTSGNFFPDPILWGLSNVPSDIIE